MNGIAYIYACMHVAAFSVTLLCHFLMPACVHTSAGYCFAHFALLIIGIYITASLIIQNRQHLMDGLPILSLNMYRYTYNHNLALTHFMQQLCEISL